MEFTTPASLLPHFPHYTEDARKHTLQKIIQLPNLLEWKAFLHLCLQHDDCDEVRIWASIGLVVLGEPKALDQILEFLNAHGKLPESWQQKSLATSKNIAQCLMGAAGNQNVLPILKGVRLKKVRGAPRQFLRIVTQAAQIAETKQKQKTNIEIVENAIQLPAEFFEQLALDPPVKHKFNLKQMDVFVSIPIDETFSELQSSLLQAIFKKLAEPEVKKYDPLKISNAVVKAFAKTPSNSPLEVSGLIPLYKSLPVDIGKQLAWLVTREGLDKVIPFMHNLEIKSMLGTENLADFFKDIGTQANCSQPPIIIKGGLAGTSPIMPMLPSSDAPVPKSDLLKDVADKIEHSIEDAVDYGDAMGDKVNLEMDGLTTIDEEEVIEMKDHEFKIGGDINIPRVHVEFDAPTTPTTTKPALPSEPPTFIAYPLIDCEEKVVAETTLEVVIGLSPEEVDAVIGDAMSLPSPEAKSYALQAKVLAPGFGIDEKDRTLNLEITPEDKYPTKTIELFAEAIEGPLKPSTIIVSYSKNGQPVGSAIFPVSIVQDLKQAVPGLPNKPELACPMTISDNETPANLTVLIYKNSLDSNAAQHGEELYWELFSSFAGAPNLKKEIPVQIGNDTKHFARFSMEGADINEGQTTLTAHMAGLGVTMGNIMPREFWELLAFCEKNAGNKTVSVLFISEEPHIPWELAIEARDQQKNDEGEYQFLAARANVGRWALTRQGDVFHPKPEMSISKLAVFSGTYNSSKWRDLESAKEEATQLKTDYEAELINATYLEIEKYLQKNTPSADLLHFALHGQCTENPHYAGIALTDGKFLTDTILNAFALNKNPFVFMNACQAGQGNTMFGDYSGLSATFQAIGASAIIAPLWKINDTKAKKFALSFYKKVFAGEAPAEVLRQMRAQFPNDETVDEADDDANKEPSAFCLAYQYFGHPELIINYKDSEA